MFIFSHVHATLQPALSIRPSISWSVSPHFFLALAQPHATSVAVYPALFREELFHFLERNDSMLDEGKVSFLTSHIIGFVFQILL